MSGPDRPADPAALLDGVRALALALPETVETRTWNSPTFRAGRRPFAVLWSDDEHPAALVVMPDAEDRAALAQDERFFVPRYFGARGALALDLTAAPVDWGEVAELLDALPSRRHRPHAPPARRAVTPAELRRRATGPRRRP